MDCDISVITTVVVYAHSNPKNKKQTIGGKNMKEIIIEEMTKDLMNEKLTLTDIDNVTGGTICDIENLDYLSKIFNSLIL